MAHNFITRLRDLAPQRRLTTVDAFELAKRQARTLLRLSGVTATPVSVDIITTLPRIQVGQAATGRQSAAAATQYSHGRWLILLNERHSQTRQRWSLAHELKHVLDHPFERVLYPRGYNGAPSQLAEAACDYFAGCLLVPGPLLRQAWVIGIRDVPILARRFGVTRYAVHARLLQMGLITATSHHLVKEA